MTAVNGRNDAALFFEGDGEMRALCRALDWSATPLGPVDGWSVSLRTIVSTVLASRNPMFLFWGPEHVQLYNDAYRPSLGWGGRHPAALGMRGREFWTDIWDTIGPQIEQVMSGGPATWHEDQYLPIERNGRLDDVWWTYSYSPVPDDDGTVGGTLVTCLETTGRVLAERRLREANVLIGLERTRLADIFHQSPSYFALLRGPDHVFELANEAYYQLVGHREIVGRPVFDALPELRGQGFQELLDGVLHSGVPWHGREIPALLARTADAPLEERFVDIAYLPMVDADGARTGVVVHGADVTDHVLARREVERLLAESELAHAELRDAAAALIEARQIADDARADAEALAERLRASEARFRDVFEQAQVAVAVLVGPEHTYSLVSPSYAALFGNRPLRGRAVVDAFPEMAGQEFPAMMDTVYRTGRPLYRNERPAFVDRDGDGVPEELFLNVRYAPLRDADGHVYAIASAAVDVTEQVLARRQLEAARADAERANQAKTDFLTTMSHELRTPLNAIAGYAELIEMGIHGPVSEAQREALSRIQRSQRHLLGLINDVLNFAKLEAGHVEYRLAEVRVRDTLDAIEPLVAPQLAAKGLRFSRGECTDGEVVRADPDKVQQILVNLLSNAIKFTAAGGSVTIRCATESEMVRIAVEDTGMGIAADRLEQVFAPFVQVDRRLNAPHEGTGLGLAISRDLARGMGGDLIVESELGVGSTFTVVLPKP